MKRHNYQWHGEKVKVKFGYCYVTERLDKPLWWYNFECNWDIEEDKQIYDTVKTALLPAIKVIYEDQSFCIANHHGIGFHKLINGGWPNYRHFSLPVDTFNDALGREEAILYGIRRFDEDAFCLHESKRKDWQRINHKEEFERYEALRMSIPKTK